MRKEKNGWNNEKKNSKEQSDSIKKRCHFPSSKLSSLLFRKFFSSSSKIDKINLAKGKEWSKNGWNNEKKNSKKESDSIKKWDHFPPSKLSTLWEFFLKVDKVNLAKGKKWME